MRRTTTICGLILSLAPLASGQTGEPPPARVSVSYDDAADRRFQARVHGIAGIATGDFGDFVDLIISGSGDEA